MREGAFVAVPAGPVLRAVGRAAGRAVVRGPVHGMAALVAATTLASALAGCSTGPTEVVLTQQAEQEPLPFSLGDDDTVRRAPEPRTSAQVRGPRISRRIGTGQLVNEDAVRPPPMPPVELAGPGTYTVNMRDVPIEQAAGAILGETLGLSYLVAPGTTGTISVQTSAPLPRADLFRTFENVLELSGFSLTLRDGTYVIAGGGESARRFRFAGAAGASAPSGVYVFPLRFVGAAEMARILEPIGSPSLSLSTNAERNILFASGSGADIQAVAEAVNVFDVDVMRGKSVSRIQLAVANPVDVARELETIFDAGPGGSLEGVVRFLPNESLRSLLVVSPNARYIRAAEAWAREYDATLTPEGRVTAVYELDNREAVDLAPILAELLTFGSLSVDASVSPAAAAAAPAPTPIAAGPAGVGPGAGPLTAGLGGRGGPGEIQARILADDVANAVIVYASPTEQEQIRALVERLDRVADQVLIEATIAEVTLNDSLDFGVRYFFETGNFAVNFTALETGGVLPIFPGFNAVFDDGDVRIALDALESVTDVDIVSAPSLLVLDNQEALLNVGDQVPIVTQTAEDPDQPDSRVVNQVEYRDTGVILNIKPRVSSSGRVILSITQEVSDVIETTTSGIDSPTIQQRIVRTNVAVDDGQALVLGGLIRDVRSRTRDSVPFLGRIPVLGALFRSTSDFDRRTELLVIITPRVVRNALEARQITDEYRRELSRPSDLIGLEPANPRHQFRRIFF